MNANRDIQWTQKQATKTPAKVRIVILQPQENT